MTEKHVTNYLKLKKTIEQLYHNLSVSNFRLENGKHVYILM